MDRAESPRRRRPRDAAVHAGTGPRAPPGPHRKGPVMRRADDITPEVRCHLERENQWYESGGKGPMPRDWENARANWNKYVEKQEREAERTGRMPAGTQPRTARTPRPARTPRETR